MTGNDIAARVAMRLRDSGYNELSQSDYFAFVQDAYDDLMAAGWLDVCEEDDSTTMQTEVYEYAVPANFAFIYELREEDDGTPTTYSIVVPAFHYRIGLGAAGDAKFVFEPTLWSPRDGKTIKVIGQKRPTKPSDGLASITAGYEPFLRERAISYAGVHLAQGSSALAKWRERVAEVAWARSETYLGRHPMEFRVRPGSKYVPGR